MTFLDVCLKVPCMVITFVPNIYKTCRKTSMNKYNGGHLGCCLDYRGTHQDAKCLPSLKINFRQPPTQFNRETLWTNKCTYITPGTVLTYKSHILPVFHLQITDTTYASLANHRYYICFTWKTHTPYSINFQTTYITVASLAIHIYTYTT